MLSLLLWNNTISSQEGLIVKSFKDISTVNQNARIFPKYDNNGDPASLVLVQVMTNDEIHLKGTYKLGDVEKKIECILGLYGIGCQVFRGTLYWL